MGCYFIDDEYICSKCITSEELNDISEEDIFSDDEIEKYHFVCDRCGREILPYGKSEEDQQKKGG